MFAEIKKNRTVALEAVRFFAWGQAVVLIALGVFYLPGRPDAYLSRGLVATAGSAVFLAFALANIGLPGLGAARRLGWANKLTFLRFLLVGPICVLVADGLVVPALVLYGLSCATDVADGIVARRFREETAFGVLMDPAADIATTAGLFSVFFAKAYIPGWVLAVLAARYASLAAGAALIRFTIGPTTFPATPTGKIVGVLQAAAGILILVLSRTGMEWREQWGWALYPFLGIIFGSVIVSQLVIGVRHIKKGVRDAGSQR
jgi:phosphatidylglycerophosphate synthase